MIETSAPVSLRVLASCHTLRSKGSGRFSTTMSICFPSNIRFALPVYSFIVLFVTDRLRQSHHINDGVRPFYVSQDVYIFLFFIVYDNDLRLLHQLTDL